MDKKLLFLFVLAIFFCLTSFALVDTTSPITPANIDNQQQLLNQQTLTSIQAQISQLNTKIDALQAQNQADLTKSTNFLDSKIQNVGMNFVAPIIVVVLAGLGLHWAIKLALISKGLLVK